MDTVQLTRLLRGNRYTKRVFQGVYPSDQLPKKLRKPAIIIANTDPANKPGTHWVAIYYGRNGETELFNSFGISYPATLNNKFSKFLTAKSKNYTRLNTKRLQSSLSTVCGQYCCMYTLDRSKGNFMNSFLRHFSYTNLVGNDEKILKMFDENFKIEKDDDDYGDIICNQVCKARRCANKRKK